MPMAHSTNSNLHVLTTSIRLCPVTETGMSVCLDTCHSLGAIVYRVVRYLKFASTDCPLLQSMLAYSYMMTYFAAEMSMHMDLHPTIIGCQSTRHTVNSSPGQLVTRSTRHTVNSSQVHSSPGRLVTQSTCHKEAVNSSQANKQANIKVVLPQQ